LLHSAQCLLHLGRKAQAARLLKVLIETPNPHPWHAQSLQLLGLCDDGKEALADKMELPNTPSRSAGKAG
jgi:hypothetical protein